MQQHWKRCSPSSFVRVVSTLDACIRATWRLKRTGRKTAKANHAYGLENCMPCDMKNYSRIQLSQEATGRTHRATLQNWLLVLRHHCRFISLLDHHCWFLTKIVVDTVTVDSWLEPTVICYMKNFITLSYDVWWKWTLYQSCSTRRNLQLCSLNFFDLRSFVI
jgi:hypothetical protein